MRYADLKFALLFGVLVASLVVFFFAGPALASDLNDPDKMENYFALGYALSSLFGLAAGMTKTDKDDKAAGWFGRILHFAAGNWWKVFPKKGGK